MHRSRYGLQARGVAYATLSIGGFGSFVISTAAPIVTGWNEPVSGRDFHPLKTSSGSTKCRAASEVRLVPCKLAQGEILVRTLANASRLTRRDWRSRRRAGRSLGEQRNRTVAKLFSTLSNSNCKKTGSAFERPYLLPKSNTPPQEFRKQLI